MSDRPPARPEDESRRGRSTLAGVRRAVAVTRLVLGWERLWRASWQAACVVGGFLALALLDVLPRLPGWLHGVALAAAALGLGLVAALGFRGFRWPTGAEAARRLERDNGLAHRPLSTLDDRPATADPAGEDDGQSAVWRYHCREMMGRIGRLRLTPPRPGLAARDPLGVRILVALALVATAAGSWGDWLPRLAAAVQPHLTGPGLTTPAVLDAWLVPPDYTGAAPIFLQRAGAGAAAAVTGEAIPVPAGSSVLVRVSGGNGVPTLTVNDAEQPLAAIDDSHFQAQETVRSGAVLSVGQGGRVLGRWAISVLSDQPPQVAFTTAPSVAEHQAVHVDYTASDRYGLAAVTLSVRLDPQAGAAAGAGPAPLVLPLPLPGLRPKSVHGTGIHDLTASPWAGLPVLLRLAATNGGGHTGTSAEVPLVLPERAFANPLARQIIAERKALALGGEAARNGSARALSELSIRPDGYHGDLVVFLSLRVAAAQLLLDHDAMAIPAVRDLLWETALRLEDGGVSLAERDLHDAEAALAEALDRKAGDDELRRKMDDLQTALNQFLDSLENGQENPPAAAPGDGLPPDAAPLVLERPDLEAMVNALRDMAETGARDQARQALADLSHLLDGLRSGTGPPDPSVAPTLEVLRQLQDLTARQRALLDRTFRQSQSPVTASPQDQSQAPGPFRGPPPPGGRADTTPHAADQGLLRQQLGTLMERLEELRGESPRPLGEAGQAMHEAEQALREGDAAAAAAAEAEAVAGLEQGLRRLGQGLSQGRTGTGGLTPSGDGRDPLGRLRPGVGTTDSTEVGLPEVPELQKAREILDELRRRAGQRERPHQELDYIDRLLRQF